MLCTTVAYFPTRSSGIRRQCCYPGPLPHQAGERIDVPYRLDELVWYEMSRIAHGRQSVFVTHIRSLCDELVIDLDRTARLLCGRRNDPTDGDMPSTHSKPLPTRSCPLDDYSHPGYDQCFGTPETTMNDWGERKQAIHFVKLLILIIRNFPISIQIPIPDCHSPRKTNHTVLNSSPSVLSLALHQNSP